MLRLLESEPLATALLLVVHQGDLASLKQLLNEHPALAAATIVRPGTVENREFSYPTLCAATDWPGHFPNVGESIRLLIAAGAEVHSHCSGPHEETPLHWAASSDDLEALDALLDEGAHIDAHGAVIAGGTPLADAVAFGQWNAARRLIQRGAKTNLWQAAALGLLGRLEEQFDFNAPTSEEVTAAFWCACHGGQQAAAEYLLARGADLNWIGYDNLTPLDAAVRAGNQDQVAWLRRQGAASAKA